MCKMATNNEWLKFEESWGFGFGVGFAWGSFKALESAKVLLESAENNNGLIVNGFSDLMEAFDPNNRLEKGFEGSDR